MVDFKKLRENKAQSAIIDPIDIFRHLPKPAGINDVYTSQAQVLEEWYSRRNEKDIIIKLHTGGGKTLVGLLIAKSILIETHEPVLYLCPTTQLVEQIISKSEEYGLPCISYEKGVPLQDDFLAARKPLVCTYEALFNGRSKFGVTGISTHPVKVGAIILDDAHVAYSKVRDAFTLRIIRQDDAKSYEYLTNIFRLDFDEIGRLGTFDDTISGEERYSILEVPYWSWENHKTEVREYLRNKNTEENFIFAWPLIRDSLDYCHLLISKDSFVITPYFPLVDMFPTFTGCPKRIFMSATIADDSAIIRTFNADIVSVSNPITSNSLAGVSERMILMPETMSFNADYIDMLHNYVKWSSEEKSISTIILVPSNRTAASWNGIAIFTTDKDETALNIKKLQQKESIGPFVFANRYDGIDLPGESCRQLIFDGMPKGLNEYENYLSIVLEGSVLTNSLAQKIEQGIGRGARGSGDYCVVIFSGKDVISWLANPKNIRFLTRITRAELEMGINISQGIQSKSEFWDTINKCLNRDPEWVKYHAETLADLADPDPILLAPLELAKIEQNALKLWRDGHNDKAIAKLLSYLETESENLENDFKGWLYQLAARIAYHGKRLDDSLELQQHAYSLWHNLHRPKKMQKYVRLVTPGKQSEQIVAKIIGYRIRKGYVAQFDEAISHLVPGASANQFEQALAELGGYLGFVTERPEKVHGVGPDVLWLLNDNKGLVIEAKSRKNPDNPFSKEQLGQLLTAQEWFKREYPHFTSICISVHPNRYITPSAVSGDTKVLVPEKLNELISNTRMLLVKLSESHEPAENMLGQCEEILTKYLLTPEHIIAHYFTTFETMAIR